MLNLSKLLGEREFRSKAEVVSAALEAASKAAARAKHKTPFPSADEARELLIFNTSRQRNWIVRIGEWLVAVLDDVRKPKLIVLTIAHIPQIVQGDPTEWFRTGDVEVGGRKVAGLVQIGNSQERLLFSTDLFANQPINVALESLARE